MSPNFINHVPDQYFKDNTDRASNQKIATKSNALEDQNKTQQILSANGRLENIKIQDLVDIRNLKSPQVANSTINRDQNLNSKNSF